MTCEEATRLLGAYRAALAAYDGVRSALRLVPEHLTLEEAAHIREHGHLAMVRARRAYWRHLELHSCRRQAGGAPPTPCGTLHP